MTKLMKLLFTLLSISILLISFIHLSPEAASSEKGSIVKLRLMETTDLHGYVVPYNYFKRKTSNRYGLALTATLIKKARKQVKNSMLFDDGDLLKGSLLDEYARHKGLKKGEIHPVVRAMNLLHYDAATVGNHDFNFGLDFMHEALNDANYPYVNANIYYDDDDHYPKNDRHYFKPYLILPRTFVDENGHKQTIKIGVIGLTLPQTIPWNHPFEKLEGKIKIKDIYQTARKYVPEMKRKGADVIVVLSHSGLGSPKIKYKEQNASYDLTYIKGVDAILFGHVHKVFPGPAFARVPKVNLKKGTINGVAAVEAGMWGDHLGIIDLTLKKQGSHWKMIDSHSKARPVFGKTSVHPDSQILKAVSPFYKAMLDFSFTPEGAIWESRP